MPSILEVCDSYVGIKENPARSNRTVLGARYGQNGVPWCGIAACMAFQDAGIDLRKILTKNMASTVAIQSAAKKKGWIRPARQAIPTDIALFHMPGGRRGVNHVGIVKSVTSSGLYTYEGNTSVSGSQYAGGAYLVKFRPWGVILGVIRVPFAAAVGVRQAPSAPPPAPAPAPDPHPQPVYDRPKVIWGQVGQIVRDLQFELAAVCPPLAPPAQAQWDREIQAGHYGEMTKWRVGVFAGALGLGWLNYNANSVTPQLWYWLDAVYSAHTKMPRVWTR